jgi:hypothetical protein
MTLIARTPSQELVDLVGALAGTWHGQIAHARCPAHADGTPSLTLRQGDRGILVTCFAGCNREDILRELSRVRPGYRFPRPDFASERPGNDARVEELWMASGPVAGTLAESYLRFRRLDLTLPDLRFHPRCPFGKKPHTVFEPALLVGVRHGDHIRAFQRIFLKPDGRGYVRKATLGELGTAGWRGATPSDTLAIAEGFEDAAAFQQLSGIASWSSFGARRLSLLSIPATVSTLILAQDNDPEGRRAALAAYERYSEEGLVVMRRTPPGQLKDWAKVLER